MELPEFKEIKEEEMKKTQNDEEEKYIEIKKEIKKLT